MREQRQRLARCIAGALVLGTLVVGAVVPAGTAATASHSAPRHWVSPGDTGWNGT